MEMVDDEGNVMVTDDSTAISFTPKNADGTGTHANLPTVTNNQATVSAGVATFASSVFDKIGSGYTLYFSAHFRAALEAPARQNIVTEISQLASLAKGLASTNTASPSNGSAEPNGGLDRKRARASY